MRPGAWSPVPGSGVSTCRRRARGASRPASAPISPLISGGTALGSARGEHVVPVLTRGKYHWVFALSTQGLSTERVCRCDRLAQPPTSRRPGNQGSPGLAAGDRDGLASRLANDHRMRRFRCSPTSARSSKPASASGARRHRLRPDGGLLVRNAGAAIDLAIALARPRGRPRTCAGPSGRSRGPDRGGGCALMANLVNLERATIHSGTRVILDGVSLGIGTGDRIGVVGANGGGKSTLLRVLARHPHPRRRRVTHTGGLQIAEVAQDDDLPAGATIRGRSSVTPPSTKVGLGIADPRGSSVAGRGRAGGSTRRPRGRRRPALRRRTPSRRPRPRAGRRCRPAHARRADQPSRRRGVAWLARYLTTTWARPDRALIVVTRPLVPGRGGPPRRGRSTTARSMPTTGVCRIRPRPCGTRSHRGGNRGARQPAAQGTRVAAPGAPARTMKFRLDAAAALISDEPPRATAWN